MPDPLPPTPVRVAIDVGSLYGHRTGVGVATAGIVDALRTRDDVVLDPGEQVAVQPGWLNQGTAALPMSGAISAFVGPVGATYSVPDRLAAYGTINPGQTASCTGDCYVLAVSNPPARPAVHWDASAAEVLSNYAYEAWAMHVGGSFGDVATTSPFYRFIETIFHNSITGGCGPGIYCPGNSTLRKQMAAFVLKAVEGSTYVPPAATGVFNDVPVNDPFAPYIEELFRRGVVTGCAAPGGPNYCPNNEVLRQQMAIFLLRTKFGSAYVPPPCRGIFGDMPCSSPFAAWVEDIYDRGITGGCQASPLLYCGTNPVTRGQMAVFLTKTFGLTLYGL